VLDTGKSHSLVSAPRMGSFFASPRRRRRLAWGAGLGVLALAVVIAAKAMPGAKEMPPETFSNRQAVDVVANEKLVKVTRRDRAAINKTLDRFVPAAVARKNPAAAYAVSTPNLRSQASARQWRAGDIPVHPFPARGRSFHGWTVNYAKRNHVNLDLLVMPDLSKELRPIAFTIDVEKIKGQWLVDAVLPIAVFAPLPPQGNRGPVISTYDLVPTGVRGGAAAKSRLSYAWFAVPFVLVGGGILFVLALVARVWLRDRRVRHRPLPPLRAE
jgi:hypothetical protein